MARCHERDHDGEHEDDLSKIVDPLSMIDRANSQDFLDADLHCAFFDLEHLTEQLKSTQQVYILKPKIKSSSGNENKNCIFKQEQK